MSSGFLNPLDNTLYIAVAAPVVGEQDGARYTLLGLISPTDTSLAGILRSAVDSLHTGHGELLDDTGRVLVSTEGSAPLTLGDHPGFYHEMRI